MGADVQRLGKPPGPRTPASRRKHEQTGDAEPEDTEREHGIRAQPGTAALRPRDDPHRVDRVQRDRQRGEPAVQPPSRRERGRPRDQGREREEAELKGVAAEVPAFPGPP